MPTATEKTRVALRIGQVASRADVSVETVRYYERQGLLAEPARKDSGYREYGDEVVGRLRFIRRAKELGFSLKEIAELLSLQSDPQTTCAKVKARALAKLADIDEKLRDLTRVREALEQITVTCTGRGPLKRCSILEALNNSSRAATPKRPRSDR